ncbi:formate/nitrite transporter family protein [Raineyella sp.]|uniref:formate/nitrite transporter family protein n=1 Tax=Raineyella sp. TaxID=1911550 RepID=UPI002B2201F5|nr:formate/nitrite transporter family protein [Raineyella sp.]MEA5153273.1 formate/nitrite transporter family protein [Raineyella sp.]
MEIDDDRLYPGRVFIENTLEAADTKVHMSSRITVRYLQRAAMAGFLIGLFYVAYHATAATFAAVQVGGVSLVGFGKMLGSFIFGWALVFIFFTRSELLTSNMMVVSIAHYHRRTTTRRALRVLATCFLGNALGGLVLALLLKCSTLVSGAVATQMAHAVEVKLGYLDTAAGVGDLFVRAILCNLVINVAMLLVYNGFVKDSITMTLTMVAAVFVFAFLGLEHSVANTVFFLIVGLSQGIDVARAAGNVAIALVGNFIGGGILIGYYYAYVNNQRPRSASVDPGSTGIGPVPAESVPAQSIPAQSILAESVPAQSVPVEEVTRT